MEDSRNIDIIINIKYRIINYNIYIEINIQNCINIEDYIDIR
jgi:hypothetical protein